MLKLLKYELRKARTPILILLGLTAAAEAYFLAGLYVLDQEDAHFVIALLLMMFLALAAWIVVLVRGVTSYSGELKSRSSYLIFMTPHSTRKIMASKFLFSLLLSGLFWAVGGLLCAVDFRLLLEEAGEYEEFIADLNEVLTGMGIHADQILLAGLFTLLYMVLSFLSFFAVAYLAVTLSHTFFRDKSWRWVMAVVFYIALNYGISALSSVFPAVYTALNYADAPGVANIAAAYDLDTTPDFSALLVYLVPQALISLGTILASLFGCAFMLEKKISL